MKLQRLLTCVNFGYSIPNKQLFTVNAKYQEQFACFYKKSQTKMVFFSRTEQANTKKVTALGLAPIEINVGKTSTG